MANLLVIEDEENLRFTIRRALTKSGYHVTDVATLKAAREAIAGTDFDVVLTDVMLGAHDNGLEFVKELREPASGFDGSVVVMTAFSSIENAVAAMRLGADDYIQKPLSLEELSIQVKRWVELRQLKKRVKLYQRLEKSREQETEVVGESAAWRATLSMADRLAAIPLAESVVSGAMNGVMGVGG
ncbi:MAG: response regulator, partial [Phycisphaerales bacterium]|nr:response regulator [Phycisphaerales bacterium]